MQHDNLPSISRLKADAKCIKREIDAGQKSSCVIGLADGVQVSRSDVLNYLARQSGYADWTEFLRHKESCTATRQSIEREPADSESTMPVVRHWYLTEHGWVTSDSAGFESMIRGRDIFAIVHAARHSLGGASRLHWFADEFDLATEQKAERLQARYGKWPEPDMQEWIAEYAQTHPF